MNGETVVGGLVTVTLIIAGTALTIAGHSDAGSTAFFLAFLAFWILVL